MTGTVLCDADGNLFPSEEPAFVASADVTNAFLAAVGVDRRYEAEELRLATTGKNFRTTAVDLAREAGVEVTADVLQHWVQAEADAVTRYLGEVLRPDPEVRGPLARMAQTHALAAVSSSALRRLDACFRATGIDDLLPAHVRFSAEDSLPVPTSKPDPAVYLFACASLGVGPDDCLAVEDSVPGATSAVRAGIPTVGLLQFVQPAERAQREADLRACGVLDVVGSWAAVEAVLRSR